MKNPLLTIPLIIFVLGCETLGKKDVAKDYYIEAKEFIEDGSYSLAIEILNDLQSKYPYGQYSEYAWLEKAYAYLKSGDPSYAQIEIEEFVRNYPGHKETDYALFILAISEEARYKDFIHYYINSPAENHAQPFKKALQRYQRLIQQFPNSRYTQYAKKAIKSIKNYLALHELKIAQNYQEKKAWVASINRANYIIKKYPTSVYTDEALLIMKEGYLALGLDKIAEDIQKVYNLNKTRFNQSAKNKGKI